MIWKGVKRNIVMMAKSLTKWFRLDELQHVKLL